MLPSRAISVGGDIRMAVQRKFSGNPNGKHFTMTVLMTCMLPTPEFHVLSRTGHTDINDIFWLHFNSMLHSSTHLKYQELSIFYAFMKGILPSQVIEDLYNRKPGRSMMKLLSFSEKGRNAVDPRGWTYVHLEEL